ncbi:MAG TPA: hypothetical protein VGQ20_03515, partial [Acidimicrobiales bacterium]|nr:hypothetical protein [Acidimicrobiales bacterium]
DLARGGFASPLTIEPNTAYSATIAAASAAARASHAGLWGTCGGPGVALNPDGSIAGRGDAGGG